MSIVVRSSTSASEILDVAAPFLSGDPVRHNLVLTLLHNRVEHGEAGRYWLAVDDGACVGVVFHSPLHFIATLTPMANCVVEAVVDAMIDTGAVVPGVSGSAATAAAFAGHWTERTNTGASPVQGQRIYEVTALAPPAKAEGGLRRARPSEYDRMVDWFVGFRDEVGDSPTSPALIVRRLLDAGRLWVWDDGGPVAVAGLSDPSVGAGVVRIGPVYTPPEGRRRGYASALVAGLSAAALADGHRCILYTELSNPVSNSIYRGIGYRACTEVLRYEFAPRR